MVYETFPSNDISDDGPKASRDMIPPTPSLFSKGVSTANTCVLGAPFTPTHCDRCNNKAVKCPLLPANAGLTLIVLYIYCVNCGSCCPYMEMEHKKSSDKHNCLYLFVLSFDEIISIFYLFKYNQSVLGSEPSPKSNT